MPSMVSEAPPKSFSAPVAQGLCVGGRSVFLLVGRGALEAEVGEVGAPAVVAAGVFAGFFPLFSGNEIFEGARADDVGAFADKQRARAVFGFDGLDAGIDGAMLFRWTLARRFAFSHLGERANMLFGGAAATADEI